MIKIVSEASAEAQGLVLLEQFQHVPLIPHGRDLWQTTQNVRFCVDAGPAWVIAEIPSGFVCDLDSVPREILLVHAWMKGRTRTAAVLHDALYRNGIDRELADKAFLRAMKLEGVRKRYRLPIYWAVRLFGGTKFKKVVFKSA
jgi:hypothetical protein